MVCSRACGEEGRCRVRWMRWAGAEVEGSAVEAEEVTRTGEVAGWEEAGAAGSTTDHSLCNSVALDSRRSGGETIDTETDNQIHHSQPAYTRLHRHTQKENYNTKSSQIQITTVSPRPSSHLTIHLSCLTCLSCSPFNAPASSTPWRAQARASPA